MTQLVYRSNSGIEFCCKFHEIVSTCDGTGMDQIWWPKRKLRKIFNEAGSCDVKAIGKTCRSNETIILCSSRGVGYDIYIYK